MSGDGARDVDGEYAAVRARARRRWPWSMVVVGLGSGVLGSQGARLHVFGSEAHRHHASNPPGVVTTIIAVASALAAVALLVWIFRLTRREDGWLAAPTAYGLPRRQRRAVGRAVRRARPSADSVLRRIETESARRLVRQAPLGVLFCLAIVALSVLFALLATDTPTGRVFYCVLAGAFVAMAVFQRVLVRQAGRYLAIVRPQDVTS